MEGRKQLFRPQVREELQGGYQIQYLKPQLEALGISTDSLSA
jgi:hypothetical protein